MEYNQNKYTAEEMNNILQNAEEVLLKIEKEFSISQTPHMKQKGIDKSTLMQINDNSGKNLPVKVTDEFLEILAIAEEMYNKTSGLFDISIGSLTKLWQISEKAEYCMNDFDSLEYLCSIPTEEEINKAKTLINYQDIKIDAEQKMVSLTKEGMALDFGAIGKGYAVEKLADYLSEYHFSYVIINMGGNVKVIGESLQDTLPLKIYVNDPFEEGTIGY